MERRVFGPVPSRRLGKSLGVNNIPHKICTYSCVYCQVGKAVKMQVNRQDFYKPGDLLEEVKVVLESISEKEEYPDYITIVPDGEPTLDRNLGELINSFKSLGIPVAVISNGSLINLPEVQNDLLKADYVSVKSDSVNHDTWRKVNKPHKNLNLDEIKKGVQSFARKFKGKLVTETMLIKGMNDTGEEVRSTAGFIKSFNPGIAYIAIPTRPPAFSQAVPADEIAVNRAFQIFKDEIGRVELLTGYEGNAFSSTGNFKEDILSITAVHPMREDAVMELLHKTTGDENTLDTLLEEKSLKKVLFGDHYYYMRRYTR